MSKRGRIPISDAAEICVATYGRSKKLCKVAGAIGDQIADAVLSGKVAPPSEEPEDGPAETMVRRRREDERDDLLGMFKGLLAVIHRDGGQYVDEHGLEKACEDARQVWSVLQQAADERDGLKKRLLAVKAASLKDLYDSEVALLKAEPGDGCDRLLTVLYGESSAKTIGKAIGGSQAPMLHDAAARIRSLETEVKLLNKGEYDDSWRRQCEENERLEAELAKLRKAAYLAYWHTDAYAPTHGGEDEIKSQEAVTQAMHEAGVEKLKAVQL